MLSSALGVILVAFAFFLDVLRRVIAAIAMRLRPQHLRLTMAVATPTHKPMAWTIPVDTDRPTRLPPRRFTAATSATTARPTASSTTASSSRTDTTASSSTTVVPASSRTTTIAAVRERSRARGRAVLHSRRMDAAARAALAAVPRRTVTRTRLNPLVQRSIVVFVAPARVHRHVRIASPLQLLVRVAPPRPTLYGRVYTYAFVAARGRWQQDMGRRFTLAAPERSEQRATVQWTSRR